MFKKISFHAAWFVFVAFIALMAVSGVQAQVVDDNMTATMTINITPSGGGSCLPGIGSMAVEKGHSVALAALPAVGYKFVSWSWEGDGNPMDPLAAETSIFIIGDITLTARFALQ